MKSFISKQGVVNVRKVANRLEYELPTGMSGKQFLKFKNDNSQELDNMIVEDDESD